MYDFKNKRTIDNYYTWQIKNFANKDYIPFSMIFTLVNADTYNSKMSILETLDRYKKKEEKWTIASIKEIENRLRQWLDQVPINLPFYRSNRQPISKFYQLITENLHFRYIRFNRSYISYVGGYYTLFTENTDNCYFMLVIKREYLRYVKLCILLNEPIMEDCYEFWYDEKYIETAQDSIRLKRLVNKILKELKSMDIPCINKENIVDLFKVGFDFKAPTISAQKEMLAQYVEKYQKEDLKNKDLFPTIIS